MTHEQRALAKNAQKVQAVLDRCIDGVTLSQITGDTQLSSKAARDALKHMGAELEDGLWFEGVCADVSAKPVDLPSAMPTSDPACTTCETKTDPQSADFDMGEWGIQNFRKECQRVTDQQAKSDFALALEAERQRVLDAVEIGGTVERLAELTGIPVDDVQMHLDVLIDDGAVIERPVIVAMSYKVAT